MNVSIYFKRLLIPFWAFLLFACGGSKSEVKIGEQVWMAAELDVAAFRNGDPIPEAKSFSDWKNALEEKKPMFSYCEFKAENAEKFGKMYNQFAVTDPRGLAPEGWRIPTEEDWEWLKLNIVRHFPGETTTGPLKAKKVWDDFAGSIQPPASNRTGFSAKPSVYLFCKTPNEFGTMIGVDGFQGLDQENYHSVSWWCEGGTSSVSIGHDRDRIGWGGAPFGEGHHVRCLRE